MWLYRKEAYPSFRSMKWIGMLLFTGGTEDLTIVFNSTSSDKVNRFPETRVTDSTWADLNNEPHHLISIKGCQLYQKRLYRQEPWRLFWRCRMARHSFHKLWLGGKQTHCTVKWRPIIPSHALVRKMKGAGNCQFTSWKHPFWNSCWTLAILAALSGALNSRSAQFFALNQALFKVTNQIAGKWKKTFWKHTYNFRPLLWRWANTRNVSFRNSLRWSI